MSKRLWLVLLLSAPAAAQTLSDPTRPSGEGLAAKPQTLTAEAAELRLSLVRLGAAPLAVINGQSVRPGEHIAGYRLKALRPGAAVLAGPDGERVLLLAALPMKKTKVRP